MRETQGMLFKTHGDELVPPHSGSATSRQAAEAIEPDAETLRNKVLWFIVSKGRHGATDDEIQEALKMDGNTERPRRREMVKLRHIEESGETRPTASGRNAKVWRVVE